MAEHRLFFWQRSLRIVVPAAVGFLAGISFPGVQAVSQKIVIPITLPMRQQNVAPSTSETPVLIAQQNEAYKKVISKAVQAEKIRRLNSPLPVQFQGKMIHDVKLKSSEKGVQAGTAKPIALTFDDGPWPQTTAQVLDVLKKNNVKATFFVVGKQVEKYPQLIKQTVADGHAIANHTWNHQYHHYSPSAASNEIDRTATLVYKLTGIKTSLFRPPAGILNNGLVAYAHQKKYATIMWSADSRDWRLQRSAPQAMIDNVLKEAKPGGIVLLHDGGGDRSKTIQALPQIITQLKKRGYKFVTVPELLEIGEKESTK